MLGELHARWEREDEMARNMKVCTITTSSDVVSNVSNPLTMIGVEKTRTPCAKNLKLQKNLQKVLKFFRVWETIALLLLMILMLMVAIYLKLFCSCKSLLEVLMLVLCMLLLQSILQMLS
jgi:hypothetical protein